MVIWWRGFVDFVDDDHELIVSWFHTPIHDFVEIVDVDECVLTQVMEGPSQSFEDWTNTISKGDAAH